MQHYYRTSATPFSGQFYPNNIIFCIPWKLYTEGYVLWFMQNSCKSDCSKSSTNSKISHLQVNKPKPQWRTAWMIFPVQKSSLYLKNYLVSILLYESRFKVIHPKCSKHWPYTVVSPIDCGCSKMLNHGLNHGFFLSLFQLISCPINWIVGVLAYLNLIFEF